MRDFFTHGRDKTETVSQRAHFDPFRLDACVQPEVGVLCAANEEEHTYVY